MPPLGRWSAGNADSGVSIRLNCATTSPPAAKRMTKTLRRNRYTTSFTTQRSRRSVTLWQSPLAASWSSVTSSPVGSRAWRGTVEQRAEGVIVGSGCRSMMARATGFFASSAATFLFRTSRSASSAAFNGLLDYLYSLEQMGDGGADGFQSFVGKLAGYAVSLATILHVAEEHGPTLPNFIGSTIIKRVDQIIREFVIPHGHEFYRLGGAAEQLKQLASFILTSDLERFRAADLASNVRDLKGQSLVTINERLSPLIAGGWLDPADRTQVCRVWTLNPSVRVRFADRRRTEVIRKKAVTTMLRERRAS